MTNPEQNFYIKYNNDNGYILGQLTQKGYNELSQDEQKNYAHVIVDLDHLNGWGKYWPTVRFVNGVLDYPDNWPVDQSAKIAQLTKQLSNIVSSNNDAQKSNNDLQTQLTGANSKIKQLGQLSMALQQQLAKSNSNNVDVQNQLSKSNDAVNNANNKIKQLGGLVMQLQQQLATKNTSKASQSK